MNVIDFSIPFNSVVPISVDELNYYIHYKKKQQVNTHNLGWFWFILGPNRPNTHSLYIIGPFIAQLFLSLIVYV